MHRMSLKELIQPRNHQISYLEKRIKNVRLLRISRETAEIVLTEI